MYENISLIATCKIFAKLFFLKQRSIALSPIGRNNMQKKIQKIILPSIESEKVLKLPSQ